MTRPSRTANVSADETLFLAQSNRFGRALENDNDIVVTACRPAQRIEHRAEKQQLGSGKALPYAHFMLAHFGHEDGIPLPHQRKSEEDEKKRPHNGYSV